MSRVHNAMSALVAGLILSVPAAAAADQIEAQACVVNVEYFQGTALRLTYAKEFQVGVDAPFSDDFSTATRFRFFDAWLTADNGVPVVTISFDADVNVFNAVAFQASLKVQDQTHGETTTGRTGFFGSQVGSNTTNYTVTCQRAR